MTDHPSSTATPECSSSAHLRPEGEHAHAGVGQFDWNRLVASLVHPAKVVIIEALWSIGEPASPTDLTRMIDETERDNYALSLIAYHMRMLAQSGVLEVVRQAQAAGTIETFYAFPEPRK